VTEELRRSTALQHESGEVMADALVIETTNVV
jgi:hypothetical protein